MFIFKLYQVKFDNEFYNIDMRSILMIYMGAIILMLEL
jgi:hypothetical protein